MKKGFTMIELIFVIVILGVLAAVAIPKLNATRDDAEQAKAMTNLATLMGDLTSYYTAQGSFDKDISTMTNVPLVDKKAKADTNFSATFSSAGTAGNVFEFQIKNKPCIAFQVDGATLKVASAKATGVEISPVCKNIITNSTATQNILSGSYKCQGTYKADQNTEAEQPYSYTKAGSESTAIEAICKDAAPKTTKAITTKVEYSEDIIVPVKIDALDKDMSISFEGAGVKF